MRSGVTTRRPSAACAPTECADLVVWIRRGSTLVASDESLSPAAPPEQVSQIGVRRLGELADGAYPDTGQPGARDGADAPDESDRERAEELPLLPDRDDDQPVGLRDLRRDFRQVLRARDADRDGQADLVLHPTANGRGDADRRAEQRDRTGDVEERLVNGDALDEWREVAEHRHDLIAQALVLAEVAADEPQRRAQLAGAAARHATRDTERAGFVGRGEHDAAADGDRDPSQRWVEELLDGGIERVKVSVQDGRLPDGRHTQPPYSNTCSNR